MSRSMYFLKSGMIRIFKKKGDSQIEIDTIHAGQIIGELAFLDGNPRSAGGEALTDCTLVDISAQNFIETMAKLPDWMKSSWFKNTATVVVTLKPDDIDTKAEDHIADETRYRVLAERHQLSTFTAHS